jgi:hypothetical protein
VSPASAAVLQIWWCMMGIRGSVFDVGRSMHPMNVGLCHHGMARPQVADGGTASYIEGSCE